MCGCLLISAVTWEGIWNENERVWLVQRREGGFGSLFPGGIVGRDMQLLRVGETLPPV